VEVSLSISGQDDQESLLSLYEWLESDREMRQQADLKLVEAYPQQGSMAGEFELISLLVSSGLNIGSLAIAFANWRSSRTAPPPIRIAAKSLQVTIDSADSQVIEKTLKIFLAETAARTTEGQADEKC
jgi:HJR/Mrr/RecB family endonuclease